MEVVHPQLPFWADLTFTIGFMLLLNGMAAAFDFFTELERQSEDPED